MRVLVGRSFLLLAVRFFSLLSYCSALAMMVTVLTRSLRPAGARQPRAGGGCRDFAPGGARAPSSSAVVWWLVWLGGGGWSLRFRSPPGGRAASVLGVACGCRDFAPGGARAPSSSAMWWLVWLGCGGWSLSALPPRITSIKQTMMTAADGA